jgi:hypothetical protein
LFYKVDGSFKRSDQNLDRNFSAAPKKVAESLRRSFVTECLKASSFNEKIISTQFLIWRHAHFSETTFGGIPSNLDKSSPFVDWRRGLGSGIVIAREIMGREIESPHKNFNRDILSL